MTIFLEEPTTCSYTLTVEATFLCPLLEATNEIGLIQLSDPLLTEPPLNAPPTSAPPTSAPPTDATSTDAPPTSDPHASSQDEETDSYTDSSRNERVRSHTSSVIPHTSSANNHLSSSSNEPQSHSSSDYPSEETDSAESSSSANFHSNSDRLHTSNHDPNYVDSAHGRPKQHDSTYDHQPIVDERRSPPQASEDLSRSQNSHNDVKSDLSSSGARNGERDGGMDNTNSDFVDEDGSGTRNRKDTTSHA